MVIITHTKNAPKHYGICYVLIKQSNASEQTCEVKASLEPLAHCRNIAVLSISVIISLVDELYFGR